MNCIQPRSAAVLKSYIHFIICLNLADRVTAGMGSTSTSDLFATKTGPGLKRLGFVRDYSGFYWNKSSGLASQLYANSKHYAPASVQPRIKAVEDKVSEYSYPAFTTLQDRSDSVLRVLDSQVCRDRHCCR